MIENWRDLVAVENIDAPIGYIYYLTISKSDIRDTTGKPMQTMSIPKSEVECTLTENELCNELDKILTSFSNTCENDTAAIKRASLGSVAKQKRGMPTMAYKNARYYRGPNVKDSPVVVAEFEGKFGIFKHPKFDDYGFMIEDTI